MNGTALARRYADGFVGFACQTIGLDNALKELQLVKTIFRENPDDEIVIKAATWLADRGWGKPMIRQPEDEQGNVIPYSLVISTVDG